VARRREKTKKTTTVRNDVKVTVIRSKDGTTVEAECKCFGNPMRTHSHVRCPNLLRELAADGG
jgi:hypothetical protein